MSYTKKTPYRYTLGQTIKELRLEKHLTLREVSEKALVSLGHLSEIETGKKEASSEILDAVAEGIGVPLHEIVIEAGYRMGIRRGFLSTADAELELDLALSR